MILVGNRQEEILTRAKNRTVCVTVAVSAPDIAEGMRPEAFGMLVANKKPALPLTAAKAFAQSATYWTLSDTCEVAAEKSPKILMDVLQNVERRTKAVNSGQLAHLDISEQRAVFNSEDLVQQANGIPHHLSFAFNGTTEDCESQVSRLPFAKVQSFLLHLEGLLKKVGGTLHNADVAHMTSMSAFDYYEQSTKKLNIGHKFSYGDIMLARATNLLRDMGTPYVEPRKPVLN